MPETHGDKTWALGASWNSKLAKEKRVRFEGPLLSLTS